jgi:hypothetical protein
MAWIVLTQAWWFSMRTNPTPRDCLVDGSATQEKLGIHVLSAFFTLNIKKKKTVYQDFNSGLANKSCDVCAHRACSPRILEIASVIKVIQFMGQPCYDWSG